MLGVVHAVAAEPPAQITDWHDPIPNLLGQLPYLLDALIALPLAALLGAALAYRPQRAGTPPRTPAVIQTQILLAVVGAVVMLVVGQSLARAFGIVGVASLVRYRAKVRDPKDAGVMLAALSIGLASGVGLYLLAIFSAVFVLAFLWWAESVEPKPLKRFHLTVRTKDPTELRSRLERVLRQQKVAYELRSTTPEALVYEVRVPFDRRTDPLSNAIVALDGSSEIAVEWDEKKAG
jgi:uncharacterized membrane protein YhiD involved in acid resistance